MTAEQLFAVWWQSPRGSTTLPAPQPPPSTQQQAPVPPQAQQPVAMSEEESDACVTLFIARNIRSPAPHPMSHIADARK